MATSHIGLFLVTALAHMGSLQNSRGWQVIGIFKTWVVGSSGYAQDWFGFFDDKTHGEEIARPEWNTAATLLSFQTGTFCSWPPIARNIVQLRLSFEVEKAHDIYCFLFPQHIFSTLGRWTQKKRYCEQQQHYDNKSSGFLTEIELSKLNTIWSEALIVANSW